MVYNLEVTLAVEYAASTGRGTTVREKASYVGQGAANGALDPAFTLGGVLSACVCICQSLLQGASFFCNVQCLEQWLLPRSCFAPQGMFGKVWRHFWSW